MTSMKRRIAAVSAPVLLALSLTACGGGADGGGAPEDASQEEFCALFEDATELEDADAANDFADELAEVGTPESIEGEAREGFEIVVEFLGDVSDDDIEKFENAENEDALNDIFGGEDEAKKVTTFITEQATTCTPELGEVPAPE